MVNDWRRLKTLTRVTSKGASAGLFEHHLKGWGGEGIVSIFLAVDCQPGPQVDVFDWCQVG